MKKILNLLFVILIVLTACDAAIKAPLASRPPAPFDQTQGGVDSVTEDPSATLIDIPLAAGYGVDGGWFELYFTNPTSPLASQETGGIDGQLVEAIDSARLSVDVAIYSLSLNSIRDTLLRAHDRGVRVRMVMESDNLDRTDPQKLKEAGIPILGDRREGLMHNKFVVIDNSEVWTGSTNLTDSGAYLDNNNLIRIRSMKVAENFTKEFEEMFVDDKFGDNIVSETPNPRVTIDGTPINVYFAPDDNVQASLVDIINNAQESIYFMAFSFTADPLGGAVRARAEDGVTVAGVMDTEQVNSNIGTEFDPFRQAGLDVYRDGNEGQMHHKVMIIDESIVIFGSYNFTKSAETRNDETLLVIYNNDIAAQFMAEFQRVYAQAQR
ncbi:MAG: phospholipase D-like domain-containing protein [Anaerolineales bacterium]|nr:phospholipase D-like domain-containing protein [Anaerolineales bacterium]